MSISGSPRRIGYRARLDRKSALSLYFDRLPSGAEGCMKYRQLEVGMCSKKKKSKPQILRTKRVQSIAKVSCEHLAPNHRVQIQVLQPSTAQHNTGHCHISKKQGGEEMKKCYWRISCRMILRTCVKTVWNKPFSCQIISVSPSLWLPWSGYSYSYWKLRTLIGTSLESGRHREVQVSTRGDTQQGDMGHVSCVYNFIFSIFQWDGTKTHGIQATTP